MKILALVTDAFESQGGIARFNRDFLKALSQTKPQPEVVVLPRMTKEGKTSKPSYVMIAVKNYYEKGPFDFIFCGHLHLAPLAVLLSRLKKVPVWLQLHGIEAWQKPSVSIANSVIQMDLITAVSRFTRRSFLRWAAISPEKVRVLPNTVDENFTPGPKPDYLLKRYGLENKRILLTISRLSSQEKYKGQDRVIRILPRLLAREPHLVYAIGGAGDDRARLETLSREYGIAGKVKFLGEINETELVDHYRMADLFVMPSTGEGFGIVFLEAARAGIPVVAAGVAGSPDALLEGRLGRLVNPNDPAALVKAIEESLASKNHLPKPVQRFSSSNFNHLMQNLVRDRLIPSGIKNG